MKIVSKNDPMALKHARTALSLMTVRGIDPTPINYAVWYHYSTGARREMNRELDELLSKKDSALTDEVGIYFYNKYISTEQNNQRKAAESVSHNTQNVLAGIMGMIDKVSGDTQSYSQQIDEQVGHMAHSITDPALKAMTKEIIARALAIRDSGTALGRKLEDSRKEVDALKQDLEKVTMEANMDFLTKVANRKALDAKLSDLAGGKDKNDDTCLLMIDIDHFKRFNDTHGHLVGDEVLRKVGRSILDCVKGKDFVARYGGEEFAVLLPQTNLSGGIAVAEHIRKNIAGAELLRKDTGTSLGGISVSIGVARFRPQVDSIPLFLSRADNALYRSKMGGRNRVTQESFDKNDS